jgi:hypothetical protein
MAVYLPTNKRVRTRNEVIEMIERKSEEKTTAGKLGNNEEHTDLSKCI